MANPTTTEALQIEENPASTSNDSLPKGTDEEGKVDNQANSSTFDDLGNLNVDLSEFRHDDGEINSQNASPTGASYIH